MKIYPAWQYDEFRQTGAEYTDPAQVQAYDSRMQKLRDIKKEAAGIIERLRLNPACTLLELGTGTGHFALEAAKHCKMVYAADVSQEMLEYARHSAGTQGITNIRFFHAGFLTYEHHGELLDAVVSQLALHHLPDFWKLIALRRVSEMLKPGGKLLLMDTVYSFEPDAYEQFFNNWIETTRGAAGEETGSDLELAISEEYSTLDWIMEKLIMQSGFTIDSAEYFDGFMAVYLCTRQQVCR